MNSTAENQKYVTTVQETRSKSPTLNSVPKPNSSILVASVDQNPQNLSILPLKSSSPILTNKAAGPTHSVTLPPPIVTSTETLLLSQAIGPSPSQNPPPLVSISHAHEPPPSPSLVERLRASEDKSLKRLAPVSFSENGRPRIIIPDEVFHKGAEIHKTLSYVTSMASLHLSARFKVSLTTCGVKARG